MTEFVGIHHTFSAERAGGAQCRDRGWIEPGCQCRLGLFEGVHRAGALDHQPTPTAAEPRLGQVVRGGTTTDFPEDEIICDAFSGELRAAQAELSAARPAHRRQRIRSISTPMV